MFKYNDFKNGFKDFFKIACNKEFWNFKISSYDLGIFFGASITILSIQLLFKICK